MSDFFMPTNDNGYWNKKQEEQKTQQAAPSQNSGYWQQKAEKYNQAKEQHYENWNRYGVEVPDEYYNIFNQIISKAETPEQAQEEAYRIGSAVKYSMMLGLPLDEAYKNVDSLNEAQFTDIQGQKGRYEALSDMFTLGNNNVELGKLGQRLMRANSEGDTELAAALTEQIKAIESRNELLQDRAPRSWVMQALEAGAQSLPFTGAVAGAGIIGNFIAPAAGTGAAFLTSSFLSSGQEYIDMLKNGSSHESAKAVSLVSGGIQGIIEADLGITSGIVKGSARVMGKEAAENVAKKALEDIGQKVFKRFHFGAGKKVLVNYLENYGKNILGEGTEEFLQELTSIAGQEVAAAMDGYYIEENDAKHIVKQTMEAFRGGVLGALALGFVPVGLNAAADVKEFKKVKDAAESIESPEAFHNLVKDNPIFEGMGEENLKSTTHEIWERAQARKEAALEESAKEIIETTDFAEGSEERTVNDQGEEEAAGPVARNEEGGLDIQDDETVNEDGTVSGTFRAGDRSKETDNRYGYINYTANESDKTVTIDAFKMAEGREGLRGELFEEFNKKYAGYKIEWNAIGKEALAIKESLIENNPNGKKAGLSYYSEEDVENIGTSKRLAAEIRKNIHNVERLPDGSFRRTELTNAQVATAVALVDSAAKRMGKSISSYVEETFGSRVFGDMAEFEQAASAQGDSISGKAGGMGWKQFGREVKAVIYAGENADFSTWAHEMAHVFQAQLTGDLKAQAEKAFNVIDGDWYSSKFTFADGHVDSSAEAFAYGFQDWLKSGRAESEELKNIFQKFAEFLARAYNALKKHINFTPEIEEVYNQLLAGDDSILAKAEKAVLEEDRSYRAKMKAEAEAKKAAEQSEAENEKKAKEAEREEKAETTEFAHNAPTAEELLSGAEEKLSEVENETQSENAAVSNAVENLNLTDEQKKEVTEVLNNPDETQQEKAEVIVNAASESAYAEEEDYKSLGDMLFQTTDLTQDFSDVKSGVITEKDIENHINSLIGQTFDTATEPLKIQIVNNNKAHLINSNVKLEKGKKTRHEAALNKIEKLINNASMIGKPEEVDLTHNTRSRTLRHKQNVLKYISFESPIRIGNDYYTVELTTERVKGQAPDILNLYNVHVKKNILAGTQLHVSPQGQSNNTTTGGNVKQVLFQTVFHGSPHIIRRPGGDVVRDEELGFDHSKMGSGEGAQAFGWGTYVTQVEGIANSYASKLSKMPYTEAEIEKLAKIDEVYSAPSKLLISIDSKKDFLKARRTNLKDLDNGKYEAKINRNIKEFTKELKAAKKDKDEDNIKFYEDLINTSIEDLNPNRKEELRKSFQKDIDDTLTEIEDLKKKQKAAAKLLEKELPALQKEMEEIRTAAKERPAENVYTLDIPDDNGNYIPWNEPLSINQFRAIYNQAKKENLENFVGHLIEDVVLNDDTFTPPTGEWLYKQDLKFDNLTNKEKSLFLNRAGITGISYPAQYLSGGREDNAKNYVLFNENDIKVTDWHAKNIEGNILFQIAGEVGATNLDKNEEVAEGVSRMQNLAIAKEMEAAGKDAKEIRFATGWEKGDDGKWRYEIDDSKVRFDLYSGMEEWDNSHPRYMDLQKKFFESGLTEEEQEELQKWAEERSDEQDKRTNLTFGEKIYGKAFKLNEVMNHPELFKAYPQLKDILVTVKEGEGNLKGQANFEEGYIDLFRNKNDTGSFEDWEKEAGSVLLHEVQHIIQGIEGFAKGGSDEQFTPISTEPLENELNLLREVYEGKKTTLLNLGSKEEIAERIEELEDRIEEINENAIEGQVELDDGRMYADEFEAYESLAGEVEARNVQNRMKLSPAERVNMLLKETEDVSPVDKIILFQTVYHGSGAQFDKFNTENYGYSGEGSMSFGYGTYLTDDKEIAIDYAERQGNPIQYKIKALTEIIKEEEALLKEDISDRLRYVKEKDLAKYKDELEKLKKQEPTEDEVRGKRVVYTVEIPNDGFLKWDENVEPKIIEEILKENRYFYGLKNLLDNYNKWKDNPNATYLYGSNVYRTISKELGSDKAASHFLYNFGFKGIDFPAGTIYGNGEGSRNYVIFNDEDAKIIDHLLFQTQEELYKDARSFESWQDFMEFYESFGKPENSLVPFDADAQWYQSTWEMARGVQTEEEETEQKVQSKRDKESYTADAMDAMFMTALRTDPAILDNFLKVVSQIDAIDLDSEEWQNIDESGAEARDWYERMKDFISFSLSDYNWQTAMRRIRSGNEISEGLRKRLLGEMTDTLKVRDFRAIYAEVMESEEYAVDPQDTVAARLSEKLNKYSKKYHDIVKPSEDITRVSPERRKQIAEAMANRDIAARIANGSLKLDDEINNYIKSLTGQMNEKQKLLEELEKETKADYQRIADAERRKLLKLHEELLMARSSMTKRNSEIERKIAKGLKVTKKYQRETQNINANYNEIFRKYKDLENSIQLTAEVKEAITRQERFVELKEDLNNQKKEKSLAEEVKKMRIQLVKRTMRRVPFNRIDYENAKTVIAIQRMLEPNLMGGVNRFIGVDSPFLRGVISGIITDSDYKQKIMRYLILTGKHSQAFDDFVKKLDELKTIKDFDSWTKKEREYAIKHLPKENWVKDLNLKELAKEREESIDLPIQMTEKEVAKIDPKSGEVMTDYNGNVIKEKAYKLDYSDEIGQRVKEAVGAEMFDKMVNLPFAEWTTEDLEQLAKTVNDLYTEGRELLEAKKEARKRESEAIRLKVEAAIKETKYTINDDDTPEEKAAKQKKLDKIFGLTSDIKGTEAGKEKGLKARLDRLIHGYSDMNLLRFARLLDNQSEGINVYMLYRREDECFNNKQRSITGRADTVHKVMKDNNITEADLAKTVEVKWLGTSFTVDELLYFLAADKDFVLDEQGKNDDFAPTSRNAVMFGNMGSDTKLIAQKEEWSRMDREMAEAIKNDTLTEEQKQALAIGELDKTPGDTQYRKLCHQRWDFVLAEANAFLRENPKFKPLMEAIENDYAAQYERMNEVSINEFNTPVHRVQCYVPLVRKESNGEDNVNQVKEDLLGAYGAESGKQWVNKGMTQRRIHIAPLHQKPVQTGLFNTWASSIERTEHFISYAPYVRQLNAIYKSRDAAYTRRFIEARYGKGAVEYLDNYINEVANPKAGKIREKGSEFLHTLRGRTAPAYLGWKASAIIKQGLTSPWPYMAFVNPAEYAAACFDCLNPEKKAYDAIKEKSVFMRTRSFDPIKDLIDEVSENAKSKLDRNWSKITAMGMQGLEWIDWACVAPGWLACYKKEYARLQRMSEARYQAKLAELTEKNMAAEVATSEWLNPDQIKSKAMQETMDDIEMEAVTYADDCTRQCQPSSRLTDLAPLFKNSSEAMKAFLQFQTSLNVIWQNIRYDIPYAVRQKQFERIAGTVIGYVMAGIFMNSVMDGLTGDDDEEKKSLQALRNLIFYSTTQFTDAIPMFGSEITNFADGFITGKRNFASSGTDMTPSATKLMAALTKATKGDFKKAAALTAEGIGLGIGAPVSGTKEIYKLLGKPFKEGDVNLKRGVGDVYGLAGDIIGE